MTKWESARLIIATSAWLTAAQAAIFVKNNSMLHLITFAKLLIFQAAKFHNLIIQTLALSVNMGLLLSNFDFLMGKY